MLSFFIYSFISYKIIDNRNNLFYFIILFYFLKFTSDFLLNHQINNIEKREKTVTVFFLQSLKSKF